jgi:hypothetical protein
MFANTLTITVNAVAIVLTRVNQDNFGSLYRYKTATEVHTLQFRNSTEKGAGGVGNVDRHNMFYEHRVFATSVLPEKLTTISTVYRLAEGSDPAQLKLEAAGYATLLASQRDGLIDGES